MFAVNVLPFSASTETSTQQDYGGYDSWEAYCKAVFGLEYFYVESKNECEKLDFDVSENSGGCLIATATYGSELAPQVQLLRELRDNTLLQSNSGFAFMSGFNQIYYTFSPSIADYERENPVFREAVKLGITPMISSLSILNYVEMDSESSVIGYGISLILLNVGMYFVAPAIVIISLKKKLVEFIKR